MDASKRKIIILDTTLRDGDQCPGAAFSRSEKLRIAALLERLGADIIEAGFPASSAFEFSAVEAVADLVENAAVSAMARALPPDIEKAGMALHNARKKHIHISIATSPIHRKWKLNKSKKEILKMAADAVICARQFSGEVEIGAEDATRTEFAFLTEFCHAVTEAGASVVNIADTVGYIQPFEFKKCIAGLYAAVPAFYTGTARISVHCHNDLGLATANTLAGIESGANQAEATLLGLGERAGNTPIEEIVMAISARSAYYGSVYTGIHPEFFAESARLISRITGIGFSPAKPVTGKNAYSHGSGIHQNGMAAHHETYSLIQPEETGFTSHRIVLSRHSGSRGFLDKIKEITGIRIPDQEARGIYYAFKNLSGVGRNISVTDILLLLYNRGIIKSTIWQLESIYYSNYELEAERGFSVTLTLADQDGVIKRIDHSGKAKWDTITSALKTVLHFKLRIVEFSFSLSGDGNEQAGRMHLSTEFEGTVYHDENRGCDALVLFIESYLNIVNQINARYQFRASMNSEIRCGTLKEENHERIDQDGRAARY